MAQEIGGEWRISLGTGIEQVRKGLKILSGKAGFSYRSFDEMSVEELSSLTGLTGDELQDSLIREYDLPFVIDSDGDEADIAEKADKMGFHFTRGGRFYHLTGGCHKGKAVGTLTELYRIKQPDPVFVAIGDSFNDLPMFEAVDMAFLVQKPDGTYDPAIPEGAAVKVRGAGPRGWRAAVEEVMNLD
ncbi:MAG: HAD hydrolase family protein [bacterium]|nr:MAG: HAD hydrolase family protein [bacterium]